MQIQPFMVRLLGGSWKEVPTIRIPGCSISPEGVVAFNWQGQPQYWRFDSTAVISQLHALGDGFDIYCTFTMAEDKFLPTALVCNSELFEPIVSE